MNPVTSYQINFDELSNEDIISFRIHIENQFKIRGIKFEVGEIGETVAIDFYNNTTGLSNLQKAPRGTKNVDALSRDGERYSIKTIKNGNKTGTVYPDRDDKEKQLFEYLLLVQLSSDYTLKAMHRFTWKQFLKVRQWDTTMNAWYVSKTIKALKEAECIHGK